MTTAIDTTALIRGASKALDGKHPNYGFSVQDGPQHAMANALVALAIEQQATTQHLARIATSLERIADQVPETKPKRRLWLPSRRDS